jgi:hypothetical protein
MSRSDELRKRSRRVFAISLAAAVAVHVAILFGVPSFRVRILGPSGTKANVDAVATTWQRFNVFFGPPEITAPDGSLHVEPASRVLEADNVKISDLRQPESCNGRTVASIVPTAGRVQVQVNESGRVAMAEIARSTGDACRDAILTDIASALWYQWIPNDRFPAPLDLVQPLRVAEASM